MTKAIFQMESAVGLEVLIQILVRRGYDVIAPVSRDQTIMLAKVGSVSDLPRGMTDVQEKGRYRLLRDPRDQSFFGYNLGPSSWKSYLFPERRRLWQLKRKGDPEAPGGGSSAFALLGVRACELAAIAVQDRIFIKTGTDPEYRRRRESCVIIAVHCRKAAATCFCPSMGTGPEFGEKGWDLLLTEIDDRFLVEAGSDIGKDLLTSLPLQRGPEDAVLRIESQLTETKRSISRSMDQKDIKEQIYRSISTHDWDAVGSRCLACANCTLVCPTCFCSTVEDVTDVEGLNAERWQKWDSCFHIDFSYTHGGSRRVSNASRYRQWFSHKLASWYDQFGTSGCVGCGRCITWCPVGIDITEEMRAIRNAAHADASEVADGG